MRLRHIRAPSRPKSPACQKRDWREEHKLCCSLLPVPLAPVPLLPSAALSAEVKRAGEALADILDAWQVRRPAYMRFFGKLTHPQLIDETVEPELKNRTKTRHASFTMLMSELPFPSPRVPY